MKPNVLARTIGKRLAYLLFHPPPRRHHRTPDAMGLPAIEAITRTSDGIDLHLWLIPGCSAGTAIIGHGIGLTKSASLRQARLLNELGYHVLMFDHRNHGLSGTDKSRQRLAERYSNDIAAAITFALRTWPASARLIVCGFSFSTFPTLYSLRHATSPIDGIICDSGPGLSLYAMLSDFVTGGHLPAPALVNRLARHESTADAFATAAVEMLGAQWPPDPERSASGVTPMLFLAGNADEIVHPTQIENLASYYPKHTVATLPSGHLEGIKIAPRDYSAAVVTFIDSLER